VIRNASTKQFKAVHALRSNIRWSLTGTPIQNTLDDLASLTSFLKVPLLEDATQFKRYITSPIELTKGHTRTGYHNLQKLLHSICLRRTKHILPTARYNDVERLLAFDQDEREDYSRIERQCREALQRAVNGHDGGKAHRTVLETLLSLRLYCNLGRNFDRFKATLEGECEDPEVILSLLEQNDKAKCTYCDCEVSNITTVAGDEEAVFTVCRKLICSGCALQWRDDLTQKGTCSLCHTSHGASVVLGKETFEIPCKQYPSKIRALCQDIESKKGDGKW
jgi:SWI/SNF-related matrix-associated actin-dependent regulator of chromatin subfamily A3